MKNFITIVTILSLFFVSSFPVHGMDSPEGISDHIRKHIFSAAKKFDLDTVNQHFNPSWDFSQTDKDGNTIFHLLFCNPNNDKDYWERLGQFPKLPGLPMLKKCYPNHKKFFDVITTSKNGDNLTPLAIASNQKTINKNLFYKHNFYIIMILRLKHYDFLPSYSEHLNHLINAGVHVNVPINPERSTLLHEVCSIPSPNTETVQKLLQKDGLVNIKDIRGRTPLHRCTTDEKRQLLIQYGADVNISDNQGLTPIMIPYNVNKQYDTLIHHGAWVDKIFQDWLCVPITKQAFILENGDLEPKEFAYTVPDNLPMIKASDHAQNECISTKTVSCSLRTFCIRKLVRTKSLQAQQDFLHAMAHPDLCDHIIDYLATYIAKTPGTIFLKRMLDPVSCHLPLVSPYLQSIKGNVSDAVFLTSLHQKIIDNKVPEKYAKKAATFKIEVMVPYADPYTEEKLIQLRKDAVMEKVQLPLSLLPALEWKK